MANVDLDPAEAARRRMIDELEGPIRSMLEQVFAKPRDPREVAVLVFDMGDPAVRALVTQYLNNLPPSMPGTRNLGAAIVPRMMLPVLAAAAGEARPMPAWAPLLVDPSIPVACLAEGGMTIRCHNGLVTEGLSVTPEHLAAAMTDEDIAAWVDDHGEELVVALRAAGRDRPVMVVSPARSDLSGARLYGRDTLPGHPGPNEPPLVPVFLELPGGESRLIDLAEHGLTPYEIYGPHRVTGGADERVPQEQIDEWVTEHVRELVALLRASHLDDPVMAVAPEQFDLGGRFWDRQKLIDNGFARIATVKIPVLLEYYSGATCLVDLASYGVTTEQVRPQWN